jgi:hypothetical protein
MKEDRDCSICNNDPTNHGQRDSCMLYKECNEDNGYIYFEPVDKNIRITYCC